MKLLTMFRTVSKYISASIVDLTFDEECKSGNVYELVTVGDVVLTFQR
ncbi:unnamed protein product [Callosobruchus maculatus]|uniref:Uncharacterized protein n=1 Tax=Callosobruchus maculatus TaxID=64391 RepID=A0A653BM65_CALMS|nr:unnamed protein product [Callosobruchus maculatus]